MGDFTNVPEPERPRKTDAKPLAQDKNPLQYIVAADYNQIRDDLDDLRTVALASLVGASVLNIVNVKSAPYNAVGDGTTNDTAAIQAALDSGGGLPVNVYLPPGTYRVYPPAANPAGHNCLSINYDNVLLQGAGREVTTISCQVAGGLDPNTHWELVGGAVWRGSGIALVGDRSHVRFSSFRLTGNSPRNLTTYPVWGYGTQNGMSFPADPITGENWDITNKGVYVGNGSLISDVVIEDCEIDSFRGEIVWYGGDGAFNLETRRCVLHDSVASIFSCGGQLVLEDCKIYHGLNAVECTPLDLVQIIQRNYIHDNVHGISIASNAAAPGAGLGRCIVGGNRVVRNYLWGAYVQGQVRGVWIVDNEFVDHPNYGGLLTGALGVGAPKDMTIERNVVRLETLVGTAYNSFTICSDLNYPTENVRLIGNRTERSQFAAEAGSSIRAATFNLYNETDSVRAWGNDWSGGNSDWVPGQDLPGNYMWVTGSTADTLAPAMVFSGATDLLLAPVGAQTYTAFSDAPAGRLITVELNANATIAASSTVKLDGGVSFAPGGTGGIITFMRPADSSVLYEVKRFAY